MDEKRALIELLLENSGVSPTQLWQAKEVLSVATEEQLIELARLLAEDPKAGKSFITNTLRKIRALAAEDQMAWDGIIEEQRQAILQAA
jgi:hypothetical protein